jgi:hypothetical protein
VPAHRVVVVDPGDDCSAALGPRCEAAPVYELALQRRPEGLRDRVVLIGPDPPDRLGDLVRAAKLKGPSIPIRPTAYAPLCLAHKSQYRNRGQRIDEDRVTRDWGPSQNPKRMAVGSGRLTRPLEVRLQAARAYSWTIPPRTFRQMILLPPLVELARPGMGWVEIQTTVGPHFVVVAHVLDEQGLQMSLRNDKEVVQALLTDRPHEPLGECVGSRRGDRGPHAFDPDGGEHGFKVCGELGVAIVNEKPEVATAFFEVGGEVAGGLSHPGTGGGGTQRARLVPPSKGGARPSPWNRSSTARP